MPNQTKEEILERKLGPTIMMVMRECPTATSLKGMIYAQTGILIPDNIDVQNYMAFLIENLQIKDMEIKDNKPYKIKVSYHENETGTCSYTRTNYYRGSITLNNGELRELYQKCDGSLNGFDSVLTDYMLEHSEDIDASCYDNDDNHDDYNSDESNIDNDSYECQQVKLILDEFCENNPDLANNRPLDIPF